MQSYSDTHAEVTPELSARIETAANQMVAELLDEKQTAAAPEFAPESDAQFTAHMIDRELALVADGRSAVHVALSLAVMAAVRRTLIQRAAIRALPETNDRDYPVAGTTIGPLRGQGRSARVARMPAPEGES